MADHRVRSHPVAVQRCSRQCRRPAAGLPALERGHVGHGPQAAAVGVHLRRRRTHPVPPHAVEAVHVPTSRGAAARRTANHRRAHRRHPGRSETGRPGTALWPGDSDDGDQRDAGRALRRRRLLPGKCQQGDEPLRHRGRRRPGRRSTGQVSEETHPRQDGRPGRKPGVGLGRTRQGPARSPTAKPRNWPPASSSPGTRRLPAKSPSASSRCWRTPTS